MGSQSVGLTQVCARCFRAGHPAGQVSRGPRLGLQASSLRPEGSLALLLAPLLAKHDQGSLSLSQELPELRSLPHNGSRVPSVQWGSDALKKRAILSQDCALPHSGLSFRLSDPCTFQVSGFPFL